MNLPTKTSITAPSQYGNSRPI